MKEDNKFLAGEELKEDDLDMVIGGWGSVGPGNTNNFHVGTNTYNNGNTSYSNGMTIGGIECKIIGTQLYMYDNGQWVPYAQ